MSIRPKNNGVRPAWMEDPDVLLAVERALTPEQYESLHLVRGLNGGVERDAWLGVPCLAQVFGNAAALNIVAELQASRKDCPPDDHEALRIASERLGIPTKTLKTWRTRWPEQATRWCAN